MASRIRVVVAEDTEIVLMDELVNPLILSDEGLSHQLLERLAWAVSDAETVAESKAQGA